MKKKQLITKSPDETKQLAAKLGEKAFAGLFIALYGDLGTGKTVFVKGLARGLGVKGEKYVVSPSFVILREYRGRLKLHHLDVYRLDEEGFSRTIDAERYFYSDGLTVVEWARRIGGLLPDERLDVSMKYGETSRERGITVSARGQKQERILDSI